ncbi:NCS cytosine-purine permease [Flagelloscypha sp. PMI_526]|nr:NCS cytosine-purine permease [Flagelloscypha sp. PMI_526]
MADEEKAPPSPLSDSPNAHPHGPSEDSTIYSSLRITKNLLKLGVETRGILPVPEEGRTDTQFFKIFFVWFTANFNILSFSAGALGPIFELGVRDSCLTILFFNFLSCAFPAYFCTWGPKFGLRQMVHARYTFGFYGVILPCVLNIMNMMGFCILNSILGGQTLASVSQQNLSWTYGIVIVAVISLLVSFCGFTVINWYERLAWIPVLVGFLTIVGVGAKSFENVPTTSTNVAASVLSFGSIIASFTITYSPLSSDFTCYYHPSVPSWRIFVYSYVGFLLPMIFLQSLGAAAACSALAIPEWAAAQENGGLGGFIAELLSPVGGFGKFLTVMMSLSVIGNIAMTFYSIGLNIQVFIPLLSRVPRYLFAVVAVAVVLPLAIVGQHRFYDTLEHFLGMIGYWAGGFIGCILVEHVHFRKNNPSHYNLADWNTARSLPTGLSALGALILSFGLIVPCMSQVWFVGPIAKITGDIGFEIAIVLAAILYFVFRTLELRIEHARQNA